MCGVSAQRGLPRDGCLPGGSCCLGVSMCGGCRPRGCLPGGVCQTPRVNRMTDRCKNITLPQLRCGGKYKDSSKEIKGKK